jgi:hypothetical protein
MRWGSLVCMGLLGHPHADMDAEQHRQELRALFFEREYSKGDLLLATGVTEKALEHMTKPGGPLRFVGRQQGRARKFTGRDILQIEVMRRLQFFGVSHSHGSIQAREAVLKRLEWELGGLLSNPAELTLVLYPYIQTHNPDRVEWACVEHREGLPEPWVPPAALIVSVEKIINETFAKLVALRDDTEMPRFHPLVEAARHRASQSQGSVEQVASEPSETDAAA